MHRRRLVTPKIPRFSNIVKSDEAPALQSPYAIENSAVNVLAAPAPRQRFNPRVAAYTFAFVGVLLGGLHIGAKSKDLKQSWEVCYSTNLCSDKATKAVSRFIN